MGGRGHLAYNVGNVDPIQEFLHTGRSHCWMESDPLPCWPVVLYAHVLLPSILYDDILMHHAAYSVCLGFFSLCGRTPSPPTMLL